MTPTKFADAFAAFVSAHGCEPTAVDLTAEAEAAMHRWPAGTWGAPLAGGRRPDKYLGLRVAWDAPAVRFRRGDQVFAVESAFDPAPPAAPPRPDAPAGVPATRRELFDAVLAFEARTGACVAAIHVPTAMYDALTPSLVREKACLSSDPHAWPPYPFRLFDATVYVGAPTFKLSFDQADVPAMPFPKTRAEICDALADFVRRFDDWEATVIRIPRAMEDVLRTWTNDEYGGYLGDEMRAGARPEVLFGCWTVWDADAFRLTNDRRGKPVAGE